MPSVISRRGTIAIVAGAVFLVLAGCEILPGRTSGKVVVKDQNTTVAVVFSDRDRQLIEDYYSGKQKKKLPP